MTDNRESAGSEALPEISANSPPADIVAYIKALHSLPEGRAEIEDWRFIDTLLFGAPSTEIEASKVYSADMLLGQYRDEKPWDGTRSPIWTPYSVIQGMVKRLNLEKGQKFRDLGSGFGRTVIYAGMVTMATCNGVEMVTHRVSTADSAKRKFELNNVSFTHAGILEILDESTFDGDVFYMYHPFTDETTREVFRRLKLYADQREEEGLEPIIIASRGMSRDIKQMSWLEPAGIPAVTPRVGNGVEFFKSIPKSRQPA